MTTTDTTAPAHEQHHGAGAYYGIYFALLVLTGITVGAGYGMEHVASKSMAVIVAMVVATIKASLVLLYFMHLKSEIKPLYVLVGVPVVLTIIMFIALAPDFA